jgi:hypothetical protein
VTRSSSCSGGDDPGELTPDHLRTLAHAPKGAAVEEDSLDVVLGQVPSEDRAKFQRLRQVSSTPEVAAAAPGGVHLGKIG